MYIDFHAHAYRKPFLRPDGCQPFPTPEQLIEYYDRIGVEKAILLPLIGPEFYSPQSNEEIMEIAERFPDRFVPFCNIHPQAISNSPDAHLSELMLKYKALGCKGIGEVTCNLPIFNPYIWNLMKHAEISGLPMTIHLSHRIGYSYGLYDEPGLPQLNEALARFPKLKILGHSQAFWSEISQLDIEYDRVSYRDNKKIIEGAVPKMMRRFPNLYGDISAGSGCFALIRDPEYSVKFLNEFQDRLLFGIDICSPPGTEPPALLKFLIQLRDTGKISTVVFNKITRENAVELLMI